MVQSKGRMKIKREHISLIGRAPRIFYCSIAQWLSIRTRNRKLRLSKKPHASFSTIDKQNQNQKHLVRAIFPALWVKLLKVIARNFDWYTALFAPVVIGWSNYFDSHLKSALTNKTFHKPRGSCWAIHLAAAMAISLSLMEKSILLAFSLL